MLIVTALALLALAGIARGYMGRSRGKGAPTGIDRRLLSGRWGFDQGWIYEWHGPAPYHSRLTCYVCGVKQQFDVTASSPAQAGFEIDRLIWRAGWRKYAIKAFCPLHGKTQSTSRGPRSDSARGHEVSNG